jgi:hypothetical protein
MDRLPQELLQSKKIVADMEIGESAYVPIVARTVDPEGGCWILQDATIYFEDVPVRLYRLRDKSGGRKTDTTSQFRAGSSVTKPGT